MKSLDFNYQIRVLFTPFTFVLGYSNPIQATLAVEGNIIECTSDYIQESRSESS